MPVRRGPERMRQRGQKKGMLPAPTGHTWTPRSPAAPLRHRTSATTGCQVPSTLDARDSSCARTPGKGGGDASTRAGGGEGRSAKSERARGARGGRSRNIGVTA
eukprot:988083-Rhodomonas_salina.1